jgi:hypothetical protein
LGGRRPQRYRRAARPSTDYAHRQNPEARNLEQLRSSSSGHRRSCDFGFATQCPVVFSKLGEWSNNQSFVISPLSNYSPATSPKILATIDIGVARSAHLGTRLRLKQLRPTRVLGTEWFSGGAFIGAVLRNPTANSKSLTGLRIVTKLDALLVISERENKVAPTILYPLSRPRREGLVNRRIGRDRPPKTLRSDCSRSTKYAKTIAGFGSQSSPVLKQRTE